MNAKKPDNKLSKKTWLYTKDSHLIGAWLCASILFAPYGIAFMTNKPRRFSMLLLSCTLLGWPGALVIETIRCFDKVRETLADDNMRVLIVIILFVSILMTPIGVALLRNKKTRVLNQVIVLNLSFIGYLLALSFAIDFRPKILPAFVQGFED